MPYIGDLYQAPAARLLCCCKDTAYSLATRLRLYVFSEWFDRTTHNATISVNSASCVVPPPPRRLLFYSDYDRRFREYVLSENTVVHTTILFLLGWAFLRASSESFVALNACLLTLFVPLYFDFCVASCVERDTFVWLFLLFSTERLSKIIRTASFWIFARYLPR